MAAGSGERVLLAQFGHDFGGRGAGLLFAIGRKADGADAGMAAAAVSLADLGEVDHGCGVGLGPGIGTDGHLGAEAGL